MKGWTSGSFSFAIGFVCNDVGSSSANDPLENFPVPVLPWEGTDCDGRLLCPVRAVRMYLALTEHLRPQCARLFVNNSKKERKELTKNTVSFWIRHVISRAYRLSGRTDVPHTKAHDPRSFAPSLLFKKNLRISQVLKAGVWKGQVTFTKHYLRDTAHRHMDLYSSGPVVAAQSIV